MTVYAWGYYGYERIEGCGPDVWRILSEAVEEAVADGRSPMDVLIGAETCDSADDYLDEDDVVSMAREGWLTPGALVETISERHGEDVYDGEAYLRDGAKPAFARLIAAHRDEVEAASDVIAWVSEYIGLDPESHYAMRRALPLEYHEGKWHLYREHKPEPNAGSEPAAIVTYCTEPSPETGHVGWVWWALGAMGDASTLAEAMDAAASAAHRRVGL